MASKYFYLAPPPGLKLWVLGGAGAVLALFAAGLGWAIWQGLYAAPEREVVVLTSRAVRSATTPENSPGNGAATLDLTGTGVGGSSSSLRNDLSPEDQSVSDSISPWLTLLTQGRVHEAKRGLEGMLRDTRGDVATVLAASQVLVSQARDVSYLQWIAQAREDSVRQRGGDGADSPRLALDTSVDIAQTLIRNGQFALADQWISTSIAALGPSEDLLLQQSDVLAAKGDLKAAAEVLSVAPSSQSSDGRIERRRIALSARSDQPNE